MRKFLSPRRGAAAQRWTLSHSSLCLRPQGRADFTLLRSLSSVVNIAFSNRFSFASSGHVRPLSGVTVIDSVANASPSAHSLCVSASDLQYAGEREEQILLGLPILAEKINNCPDTFTLEDLVSAMFGLQTVSSDLDEAHALFDALSKRLSASRHERWTSQHLAQIMFGMQGMSSEIEVVKEVIQLVASKLDELPDGSLSLDLFSDMVCGLHSMDADHQEVRQLIDILMNKAIIPPMPCDDDAILESIVHGMSKMDSDHAPARRLIAAANSLLKGSRAILSDDAVIGGLKALRLMDSNSKEALEFVQQLSQSIARRVAVNPVRMGTGDIVDIFSCLYGFHSSHSEVQQLLPFIIDVFEQDLKIDEIEEEDVLTMLELFASFSDKDDSVRRLLRVFREKIDTLPFMLNKDAASLIQESFEDYSFQNCQEVRDLTSFLYYKIRSQ